VFGNAVAVKVDAQNDVLVFGYLSVSFATTEEAGFYTAKYAGSDGHQIWLKRHATGQEAVAMGLDQQGNVFITGVSQPTGTFPINVNYYTVKYAAGDGTLLWEKEYDGLGKFEDRPMDLVVDNNGDVVVTGNSSSPISGPGTEPGDQKPDIYTVKYAGNDGRVLWEKREDGGQTIDTARAIATDNTGNVIVSGKLGNLPEVVIKYAVSDGQVLWNNPLLPQGGLLVDVGADSAGNVFATGSRIEQVGESKVLLFYTAKLAAANGQKLWDQTYTADPIDDRALALQVDGGGNVTVTGVIYDQNGFRSYTAKYSASGGAVIWEQSGVKFQNHTGAFPVTLAATSDGGAVVVGYATGERTFEDLFAVRYTPATAGELPKPVNIATRMRVETGDNALIAGFIITGSAPKKVIIRGIGPSLPFGGTIADPTLELDAGIRTNDNWRTDQEQEITATTIPPSSNLESAIVATLDPGPHTAILRGKGDTSGIGVVEVYDLDSGGLTQLANIATRGQVQTGDNVMIGGFIIGGNYSARVLIRAIGPSLPLSGALQDPTLELVDKNGNRISNDNWRDTQESVINATTIPPTHDNEAAIVAMLVPDAYTAIVRGKDDTTGIAVVEAYNLQ
jgi:hypothetical protein